MDDILITGGAGFIGSHLCEALVAQGRSVTAIDDLSTGRKDNLHGVLDQPNFRFVHETILNAAVLDRLCAQAGLVIHLAAAVGVKLIVDDPVRTIHTNIMGTEAVLAAANRYGCKVLLASTSEVYGKGAAIPFCEDDDSLIGPTSHSRWAYAASKMVDEFLGLAYYRRHALPVVVMRFFNTIGPRQTGRYGMVVPRLARRALRGEPLEVYGDGEQSRCFADVADTLRAILSLAEHPGAVGEVFNVGSVEEVSINALAAQVIELAGSRSAVVHIPYDDAYAPGFEDMRRRVPSIEKLRRLTGFTPQVSLGESLERVIAYERERTEGED